MFVVGRRQHRQAGDAAQRLDDRIVGQRAHVGGADHVDDVGGVALALDRRGIGAADAGDDDVGRRLLLGRAGRLGLARFGGLRGDGRHDDEQRRGREQTRRHGVTNGH